jgi:HSP20 family protein
MLTAPVPFFKVGSELNEAQNRLFRFLMPDLPLRAFPLSEPVGWLPAVEILEFDEELVLCAELPGLTKEQVEISYENELLTIQGEKKDFFKEKEKTNGGPRYHIWERSYGAFARSFMLPRTIDPAKIVAEMTNGVLTVHLPKTTQAKFKGRKIEIAAK